MKILDTRTLKGPNYWSIHHRVVLVRLDIGKFEDMPSDQIDGFHNRLQQLLPGLQDHHCSEGHPGGFLERVRSGTWIGHVVEHIALELQSLAGMTCNFGKTRNSGQKGIYNVILAYELERAGIYSAHAAVKIAESLTEGMNYDLQEDIEALKKIIIEDKPGPSTSAIIKAAVAKGIPYIRLDSGSLVQLGYGRKQKRIDATITDQTSCIAVDMAADKYRTKQVLSRESVPVPHGRVIYDKDEVQSAVTEIGFPLVIKPCDSNQGKGVTLNINELTEAFRAFEEASRHSEAVMIEKYIPGDDYRLLVINYKLVAAARRYPAMVTGNDHSTINELVDRINQDPSRGIDHENVLTKIRVDQSTEEILKKQHYSLDSVPPQGVKVMLKQAANLSQGGTAEDVTAFIHPEIKALAERTARIIGLDICGIDLIAQDITRKPAGGNAVVIEVNASPGFRMHTSPVTGQNQPVGEAVIDMLFPGNDDGRIPIVSITGTNGKTTTARLIAHIARKAGHNVGLTTTEGIYIGNVEIERGDCTGSESSLKVLRDKSVDFAVLECARGGILSAGLGFDACDTAIVTNVAEDHLGLNGIDTVYQMAEVKAVVPESVKPDGLAILNENNELSYAMKERLKCAVALFSINGKSNRLTEHWKNGGMAAYYENGKVVLINGNRTLMTEEVRDIPLTFGGKAPFMIENVLAAILASYFNRISVQHISNGLRSFVPNFENTPGRLNLIQFRSFDFIIDYAHNMHGIEALGSYIRQLDASPKIGIISAPGDRRESDIIGIGKASAEIFDRIIIRIDEDPRDRKPIEIADLLHAGIKLTRKNISVEIIEKESDAIKYACSIAEKGSLLVLMSENVSSAFELVTELKNNEIRMPVQEISRPENPYVLRAGRNNVYEYTKRRVSRI